MVISYRYRKFSTFFSQCPFACARVRAYACLLCVCVWLSEKFRSHPNPVVAKNDPWVFNFFFGLLWEFIVQCDEDDTSYVIPNCIGSSSFILAINRDHHHRQIRSIFLEFYAHCVTIHTVCLCTHFLHACMHTLNAFNEPSLFRYNNIVEV